MKKTSVLASLAVALLGTASWPARAGIPGQGTWESTLQARDLNGDKAPDAWYDTALDLTWMADANAIDPSLRGGGWAAASSWASNLNVFGTTGWRLPGQLSASKAGCDGDGSFGGGACGYNALPGSSELAHMFFVTLGNSSIYATDGTPLFLKYDEFGQPYEDYTGLGLTNTGPFANLQSDAYWSGTDFNDPPDDLAWYFSLAIGLQDSSNKGNPLYAWAVRPGDVVSTIPEPHTYALMLGGLGLTALVRRRSRREAALRAA